MLARNSWRAATSPRNAALTESATLAMTYALARPTCPPSSSATVSRLNAEKVVKPPQNPMPRNARPLGDREPPSMAVAATTPRMNEPTTLMKRVPNGKVNPNARWMAGPTRNRLTLPTAPPSAMSQIMRLI